MSKTPLRMAPKVQKNRNSHGTRVLAVELLEDKGWKIGDYIMYAAWKAPRRIGAIEGGEVKLCSPKGVNVAWLRSLPAETYKVEND